MLVKLFYSVIVPLLFLIQDENKVIIHEFHISRCEVNYTKKDKALQFSIHLFIDDLEDALSNSGHKSLKLCTPSENVNSEQYIQKYINDKVKIAVNGKNLALEMLGKETSKDKMAVWCYLEVTNITELKNLTIDNKLLLEVFNDQKNIVVFTIENKKSTFFIFDHKVTQNQLF